jgi:thioredoxin reductase (NADPH)
MAPAITVYGAAWCPDCRRVKKLLAEHQIQYTWVDTEKDEPAQAYVRKLNGGRYRVPTMVFPDGGVLSEPGNAELMVRLGITNRASKPFYDVIIVGGGPAGLTAAIYTGRDAFETLIIEQAGLGGQVGLTQIIDNFPGFEQGIAGAEFAERLALQAQRFGAEALQGEQVRDIYRDGQYLVVRSANDREYIGRTVLVSSGSDFRKLNVPGEDELIGIHVHYCATCDGPLYKGKRVMVVGGGNSGFEEGLFLSTIAKEVTIVEFTAEVRASRILQDKVAARDNMRVLTNRAVREMKAEGSELSSVLIENRETGEIEKFNPDGVFVFIGLTPNTDFLPQTIRRDPRGFIITDPSLQTTLEGVFAAGDVRQGSTKQATSAAGEGATAALMIRQYLQSIGEARTESPAELAERTNDG